MATLGEMKQRGWGLSVHCGSRLADGQVCVHYSSPSIDQLIQYLGVDFDIYASRAKFLARFTCERCGNRCASIQIKMPDTYNSMMRGMRSYDHGPGLSFEEATQWYREFEAERQRLGIKTNAEMAAYWRQWRKDQALAEKGKGDGFIGPPNPWAKRKRGRWL